MNYNTLRPLQKLDYIAASGDVGVEKLPRIRTLPLGVPLHLKDKPKHFNGFHSGNSMGTPFPEALTCMIPSSVQDPPQDELLDTQQAHAGTDFFLLSGSHQ
ncbi:hypothetical protein PAAG_12562 [Paracoccidioides lutzii Pb01]|uniref:Uncharacterized protein n=1 Tax=Paracoccidioides lutzii (strain ATCC MYA-826 / Pb01) TaxID=502779 RepID=A0A0A2V326_PARBA|nr:hypothetical protein PAAG_12562 [Paracoccidioides lutzii Pb01]KGQ00767.1 hypothetical protein PAAG_12562 [Paracoccidioides lutzii Pb01]